MAKPKQAGRQIPWLMKGESPEEYVALVNEFRASESPVGIVEETLVEEAARFEWERRRAIGAFEVLLNDGVIVGVERARVEVLGLAVEKLISHKYLTSGSNTDLEADLQASRELVVRWSRGDVHAGKELKTRFGVDWKEISGGDLKRAEAGAFFEALIALERLDVYIAERAARRDRALNTLRKKRFEDVKLAAARTVVAERLGHAGIGGPGGFVEDRGP
jgi:hypothetical protein